METEKEREEYLCKTKDKYYRYFQLASEVLTGKARKKFRQECLAHRSDPKEFTRYIVGYFLPWLKNEEKHGSLIQGEKTLTDTEGGEWSYFGEINEYSEKATGKGIAKRKDGAFIYYGTFMNDLFEGIGKFKCRILTLVVH